MLFLYYVVLRYFYVIFMLFIVIVTLCYFMLYYFMLLLRYVMIFYVMLCYVILCYVILCYVILCYLMLFCRWNISHKCCFFLFYFVFLWHYSPQWIVASSFELSQHNFLWRWVIPMPKPQPGGLKNYMVCSSWSQNHIQNGY